MESDLYFWSYTILGDTRFWWGMGLARHVFPTYTVKFLLIFALSYSDALQDF
jgi:hypothetical protein